MSSRNSKRVHLWKELSLPSGDKIILANTYHNGEQLTLYDANHNVFRLNPQGEVVWQVRRDDSNHPADWWEILHRDARERGYEGAREPFTYIVLKYPDGSSNISSTTGDPPMSATWSPDSTIWLQGSAYQQYILDPETGIAKNVTDWPVRPW